MRVLNLLQGALRRSLLLRGVTSHESEVAGQRVHHYRVAAGTAVSSRAPPVVLVHGLGGTANGFARVLNGLSHRFNGVHALDMPGSGFSPLPEAGPLALEAMVELLRRFIAEVVGRPALVVGNSLGAALALKLAERFPEQVVALALLAPAGARVTDERLAELLDTFDLKSAGAARALTRRLFHKPPLAAWLFAPLLMVPTFTTPAVRFICAEARRLPPLTPEGLSSLKMPLMLLWGGSERLLPAEGIEYFRRHLPGHAQIEVVEGFGHVPQVESPQEVIRRLSRFADTALL